MRHALTLALTLFASPALGQDALDLLQGLFGSASEDAISCAANPHRLEIIDSRPHLARIWTKPYIDPMWIVRLSEVYDVLAIDAMALTLTEDSVYRADGDGRQGGLWVMQFTQNPAGYCWRRPDWPISRCIDPQLRCEAATS